MLEYDIDDAQALLEKNLSTASRNLETLEEDLDFLRDQFTTTEVSILPLRLKRTVNKLITSIVLKPLISLLNTASERTQKAETMSFFFMLCPCVLYKS